MSYLTRSGEVIAKTRVCLTSGKTQYGELSYNEKGVLTLNLNALPYCEWIYEADDDLYVSNCGHPQRIKGDSLAENSFNFCPGCGKPIKEVEVLTQALSTRAREFKMRMLNNPKNLDISKLTRCQIGYLFNNSVEIETIDGLGNVNCDNCLNCLNCIDCSNCDNCRDCIKLTNNRDCICIVMIGQGGQQ